MIRPLTLLCALLAAGSGAYLFAVKHRSQMLDNQIAAISEASRLDAQRIRVLQAQWALETDPTRLQQLATQFTALQPMQPSQFVALAALRADLPPAGSAPPGSNPAEPDQPQSDLIASAGPDAGSTGTEIAGGLPLPPPQAPPPQAPLPAAPLPTAPVPARLARITAAVPARMSAATRVAAAPSAAARTRAVRTAYPIQHSELANARFAEVMPPRPYAPSHGLPAVAAPPETRILPVAATPAVEPVSQAPPVSYSGSGSALGMAVNLPPPQPLADGGTEN